MESIGIIGSDELCNDILPKSISLLTEFWDMYVKQELRETIDPADYVAELETSKAQYRFKGKVIVQEFDYKT